MVDSEKLRVEDLARAVALIYALQNPDKIDGNQDALSGIAELYAETYAKALDRPLDQIIRDA